MEQNQQQTDIENQETTKYPEPGSYPPITDDDTVNVDLEHGSTPKVVQNSEDEDYFRRNLQNVKTLPLLIKLHIIIGSFVCIGCLLAFHWTATLFQGHDNTFWWWIYPFCGFGLTLSAHWYFSQKKWFEGLFGIAIAINLICFLTWSFQLPQNFYRLRPWFLFPLFGTVIAFLIGYYRTYKKDQMFPMLANLYWVINLFLFLVWLGYGQGFPWFMWPICILAIPMLLNRLWLQHNERRAWVLVSVALAFLNMALFVTWVFTTTTFPWFLIVLIVSVVVIWILYRKRVTVGGNIHTSKTKEEPVRFDYQEQKIPDSASDRME